MSSGSKSSQHTRALLMLLFANLLWGLSFPLIKGIGAVHARLLPDSSTWFITASTLVPRFVFGAFVLGALYFRALKTLSRREWQQGLGLGLFTVMGMIFQNDGLQFTSASTSAFLTQFYAIMIPVCLAVRDRRSPPWTVWLSCALVIAGVAVLARLDWHELRIGRGEFESLIGSVFFMGQILSLDRIEFERNRALPVTVVMFGVEASVATIMAVLTAPRISDLIVPWTSGPWLAFALALTVFCTIGAFTIMNAWQPEITATEAGLIYCAEPVFASVMALFMPAWLSGLGGFDYANELATSNLLLGGGLIIAANVLIQLKPLPRHESTEAPS